MQMLVAIFGTSVLTLLTMWNVTTSQSLASAATADTQAQRFLMYKSAVSRYLAANPSATGSIAQASLSAYLPAGYSIGSDGWANDTQSGKTYVCVPNAVALNRGFAHKVFLKAAKYPGVGNVSSGTFYSMAGRLVGNTQASFTVTLPTTGACAAAGIQFVVIGK